MKTQMSKHTLLAALLLVGVRGVAAGVCGLTGDLATTTTCTCPTGTGIVGSTGSGGTALSLTAGSWTSGTTGTPQVTTITVGGTGNALSPASALATCTDVLPGYQIATGAATAAFPIAANIVAGSATDATGGVSVCPVNSWCPGSAAKIAYTATNWAFTQSLAVSCPSISYLGDATANAGGNLLIAITSCVLEPGYYQTAGTATTASVAVCLNNYYCVGGGAIATSVTNSIAGALACPYATTVGDATYTPFPGTSSNVMTDCYTKPGYYVSSIASPASGVQLGAGALCQANEYCPGGYPVPGTTPTATTAWSGTFGGGGYTRGNTYTASPNDGAMSCPAGTTLSVASASTAATANNDITDCVIPSGYYVAAAASSATALAACSALTGGAGMTCAGGAWSATLGTGFTSILPGYAVTAVTSSNVPTLVQCGGVNVAALYGTACTGATGSNVLIVGYGGYVTNSDVYVSAPGAVTACPTWPCTLGQSLATAGGFAIASGYYLGGAAGAVTLCPTGATCAGAAFANTGVLAYGATANLGYYVSTAATTSAVAVVTACPATGATCAGGQSLATQGGITIAASYYASGVTTAGIVTGAACPTGASCAGATGSNVFTPGYGATTLAGYWLATNWATATAAATVVVCGTGTGGTVGDVCASGVPLTTTATYDGKAVAATTSVVINGYYQVNGTTVATAAYALCPTGLTCTAGAASGTVLYSGAVTTSAYHVTAPGVIALCPTGATCAAQALTTAGGASASAGYYVSAVGVVSACPAGAVCGPFTPLNTVCTAPTIPYSWCTGVATGTAAAITPVSSIPRGIYYLYPGYMVTATYLGNAIAVSACPTGAVCLGDINTNNGGDLPYSGASTTSGYYVSAVGTVTACPAGASCTAGVALTAPGGGVILPGFYVATAGTAPAICPSGSYCPGGGNLGIAGGSFACPVNSTLTGCNDFADNAPSTVNSSPVSVAPAPVTTGAVTVTPAPVTVSPAAVTVTPAAITVTPASQPITINVPAPVVSAASTRSSALVLVLAALAALAAF